MPLALALIALGLVSQMPSGLGIISADLVQKITASIARINIEPWLS